MFQNAHIAAYGEIHMHTPPKVFLQAWVKCTQWGKKENPGYMWIKEEIHKI